MILNRTDEIAFQTNLLALNASVEAARENLSEQAQGLSELMSYFSIGEGSQEQTSSRETGPENIERRSAERPWTEAETSNTRQTLEPQRPAAANSSDQEWEEF